MKKVAKINDYSSLMTDLASLIEQGRKVLCVKKEKGGRFRKRRRKIRTQIFRIWRGFLFNFLSAIICVNLRPILKFFSDSPLSLFHLILEHERQRLLEMKIIKQEDNIKCLK